MSSQIQTGQSPGSSSVGSVVPTNVSEKISTTLLIDMHAHKFETVYSLVC